MPVVITKANDVGHKRITALLYGESGIGKTTLTTTLPVSDDSKVCYINADEGHLALRERGFVVLTASGDDALQEIAKHIEENDYEWVVIDGLDNIGDEILGAEKAKEAKTSKPNGFAPYMNMADRILRWLKHMRSLKPSVLFISHMDKDVDDVGAASYMPAFPGQKAKNVLPSLFDEVGVMRSVNIDTEEGRQVKRMIQFQPEADNRYIVKDRSGALDPLEEPDLKVIFEKIHGAVKPAKKTTKKE